MLSFTVSVDDLEVNVSLVYYEFILHFFEFWAQNQTSSSYKFIKTETELLEKVLAS